MNRTPASWDPLSETCSPTTMWVTGNVSEAMPGVPTPLSWTIQAQATNVGAHRSFVDMGAVPARGRRREEWAPVDPDHAVIAIFSGWPVGNVTCFLRAVANLPGTTVADAAEVMFGSDADPPADIRDRRRRYPAVAARLPFNTALAPRRLRRMDERTRAFRTQHLPTAGTAGTGTVDESRRVLGAASELLVDCLHLQAFITFFGHGLYQRIAAFAVAAGRPGLEAQLVSGYGGVEETGLARGLWAVAGGTLTLQQFLAEHGHHGPREGELSAASWREDPAPLERTLKTIARLGADDHPDVQLNRQSEQRQRLEGELLAALPALARAQARVVLRLAAAYLPLRERSRSVSHRLFDTARAHARHLGRCLAGDGLLPDPDAVFSLTLEEALAPALPPDVEALVAHRRERRSHYQTLRIPSAFVGLPTMLAADEATGTGELRGVPVSPGIVAGPARVVVDPSQETAPIEPGEVLVCHVTDPSWMTLMIGAAALVTDVGSVISHAAIAARELGIPCVVGTDRATSLIRTGDHVRVDGAAGTVTIDHSEE